MKRLLLYVFIILLTVSIYKDLGESNHDAKPVQDPNIPSQTYTDFTIMHIKVESGDTVLSIVEQINHHTQKLDLHQIIADFRQINPTVDPYHLKPQVFYYFPKYKH